MPAVVVCIPKVVKYKSRNVVDIRFHGVEGLEFLESSVEDIAHSGKKGQIFFISGEGDDDLDNLRKLLRKIVDTFFKLQHLIVLT